MELTYEDIMLLVFLIEQQMDTEKDTNELVRLKGLLTKMQTIYAQIDHTMHGGRVM